MTPEEFAERTRAILEDTSNIGNVSVILSELVDAFGEVCANVATLTEENTKLSGRIEELQTANMQLYLKQTTAAEPTDETHGEEKEEKKLSFEDLFGEDGNLK